MNQIRNWAEHLDLESFGRYIKQVYKDCCFQNQERCNTFMLVTQWQLTVKKKKLNCHQLNSSDLSVLAWLYAYMDSARNERWTPASTGTLQPWNLVWLSLAGRPAYTTAFSKTVSQYTLVVPRIVLQAFWRPSTASRKKKREADLKVQGHQVECAWGNHHC